MVEVYSVRWRPFKRSLVPNKLGDKKVALAIFLFFFEQAITPVCFLSLAIEQSGRAACTNWKCCVRSSGHQILLNGMHLGI